MSQSTTPRIAVGNDEAAVALRTVVVEELTRRGWLVDTFGPTDRGDSVDYPDVAELVARKVADGTYERAVLLCGTGIGMAIAANKVPGVRAAQVCDPYSAQRARMSNDAQVMTMGERTTGPELARTLLNIWLDSEFAGGGSAQKVAKLDALDRHDRAA
ncbi:RpiB/LacA/LacB family sugar-phosphate isomerase [Xylanimonas allomyrinae]|uniref:RpiB/LacA/LacB family sugar-phosphate isomerase n=1 Tax=Xylanimonas allomyrinae TaxID=2509459 RepID=A0A4P6EP73_9MICO|nr:RpiB/LacA/LacB family sugar-phosphate isomerase [Xylanimonas allomyrinae]QAY64542.1 RpiB/LacA/LacB family sugar-phosphate isomerase [Xylanimonas allomyrinae]